MVSTALGVMIENMMGNHSEVALALVSSQSSMTSLGLVRPLFLYFVGELNDMTGNASEIEMQSSPVLGSRNNAWAP